MVVVEMILMGICVTYFMDSLAKILVKRKIIYSLIKPEVLGRWFLYMFKGKFFHSDIYETPELNNEKFWSFVAHYLIGISLAGSYLLLDFYYPVVREHLWVSFGFGFGTIVLPWVWLFPSVGLGFFASKSTDQLRIVQTSVANHTNFGVGLLAWVVFVHPFFISFAEKS